MTMTKTKEKCSAARCATQVIIVDPSGFHARPAMEFVQAAQCFASDVTVARDGRRADGKSILQLMLLAATAGTQLEIICEGEDALQAIDMLASLICGGCAEEIGNYRIAECGGSAHCSRQLNFHKEQVMTGQTREHQKVSRDVAKQIKQPVTVVAGQTGRQTSLSHERIAERARTIWESKGRPCGRDVENWHEAEVQLKAEKA